jgi:uncharacterized lipoprotein YddW (UPF0748 family)
MVSVEQAERVFVEEEAIPMKITIRAETLTQLCVLLSLLVVLSTTSCMKGPQVTKSVIIPQKQLRAVWIATVANIDWPSKPGLSREVQQQEFVQRLNALQKWHMNTAVVQIKPTADAFYPSRYGPWSQYLTGVQGKDPGYDPLAFMLQETHQRNLEFHAWFNPFRVSMQSDINRLASDHPARQHQNWLVSYGGKLYYNPGEPEARKFVIESILEVVKKYEIDAVHLDDYFYPYRVDGQEFPDEETYQQYGAVKFAHKDDWRRDNVNQFVQALSGEIKQVKTHVKLGISPFGVWRNKAVDSTGSDTQASQTNYDDLFADTRTWLRHHWLDYIAPQLYWEFGYPPAAYEKLIDWWTQEVKGKNVHLYIGQAVYKVNSWSDPQELPKQLRYNQRFQEISGSIFFSWKDLQANPRNFTDILVRDIYR